MELQLCPWVEVAAPNGVLFNKVDAQQKLQFVNLLGIAFVGEPTKEEICWFYWMLVFRGYQ